MNSILSTDYYVHFKENAFTALQEYLNENFHSKMFLLVDSNTNRDCIPYFFNKIDSKISFEIIEIKAGEIYKNLNTCTDIWNDLTRLGADRKSLLINLGGGVITDMGGFVASTFKRGIKFINIPTTLLSMVDASVGGKTGIDLGVLKNQIGMFSNPEMVLIDTEFLKTVSDREMRSGLAEIIKYGFTFDIKLWEQLKTLKNIDFKIIDDLVYRSIEIKNDVVLKDLKEDNLRKVLNFGHTIGHAIESYFLESEDKKNLTHGEAIAIGMVIELYFSSKLFNFPIEETKVAKKFIINFYGKTTIHESDFEPIIKLMQYDKKNVNGIVNFILLEKMKQCKIDVQVNKELLIEGLNYYRQ
ncbi:MAG: 3-dehydroquinate synthase [Flavobacteriaceae bacterium]|nr:3-dehydroquinate synthase [Flavobacteriaceae bacterium]